MAEIFSEATMTRTCFHFYSTVDSIVNLHIPKFVSFLPPRYGTNSGSDKRTVGRQSVTTSFEGPVPLCLLCSLTMALPTFETLLYPSVSGSVVSLDATLHLLCPADVLGSVDAPDRPRDRATVIVVLPSDASSCLVTPFLVSPWR